MKNIKSISLGYEHTLLVDMDKNLYGSGRNSYGELGFNELGNYDEFIKIPLSNDIKPILVVCGVNHSMLLTDDNKVYLIHKEINTPASTSGG